MLVIIINFKNISVCCLIDKWIEFKNLNGITICILFGFLTLIIIKMKIVAIVILFSLIFSGNSQGKTLTTNN